MNKKIAILYSMLLVVASYSILTTFNLTESKSNTPDLDEAIPIEVDFIPKVSKSWNNFYFIHIKDNWSDAATKEWCSGDGSYNNPYIIENMTINATNSLTGIGILIEDSKTDYFKIQNCTIFGASESAIYILNSNNGTLFNNTCKESKNGIYVENSKNTTINENNVRLCNNGIKIKKCTNVTLTNNTAYDCGNGIFLTASMSSISKNITITQNNMTKCGLYLQGDKDQLKTHKIENNFANNKPIHYYFNLSNLQPTDFLDSGQILLYYCNDSIVSNVNASYTSRGLVLYYSTNITIKYSNFSFNKYLGVFQYYGTNNTLVNNYDISHNRLHGIQIAFSNNNSIINTTHIDNNLQTGIQTILSDNNTISGNYLFNNTEYGIDVSSDSGNKIRNNSISNSQVGLDMFTSSNTVVRENKFFNCGLFVGGDTLDDLSNDVDLSNKVNGRALYYYDDVINLRESDFSNAGQIILINCNHSIASNINTSSATQGINIYFSYNISISHCISSYNFKYGVFISTSTNISLSSFEANYCEVGIYIYRLINGTISNSNFINNREDGIYLLLGNIVRIKQSKLMNNSWNGLDLWSLTNSSIYNNTIRYNGENGIGLESGKNNQISYNKISTNEQNGILVVVTNSNVSNNNIYNNKIGISIDGGFSNNFSENTIRNNINYGITINESSSISNTIVNNTFINNGISNAYDEGTNNHWDNGVFGNFWDDYFAGQDANDDGISESGIPYIIPGGSSQDNFPLFWDAPNFIVFPPPYQLYGNNSPFYAVSIIEGIEDTVWYTLGNDPTMYNITGSLSGYINQTGWDKLDNGTVIIHFYVNDSRNYIGNINLPVLKDSIAPLMNIVEPTEGQLCGNIAPDFQIEITEPHVHSMWYRLYNNSDYTDNHSCGYIGKINQAAWNSMWNSITEGKNITIIFYANDTVGNQAFEMVNVTKYIFPTTTPPPIGDDDDDNGDGKEDADIIEFLLSPTGLIIIGASGGGAAVAIIFFIKKKTSIKKIH